MKIEELEELADDAIARWQNPNLPRLPGEPSEGEVLVVAHEESS